jgi:hypothetical protein
MTYPIPYIVKREILRRLVNNELGKNMQINGDIVFGVVFRYFPGGTEKFP